MTRSALAASGLAALALAMGAALASSGGLARADPPSAGDLGTKECRDLQLAVQDAISDGGRGRAVRTAARIVVPRLAEGEITGACAACILRPIGRRPRGEDAESCGPDRICGDGELDPGEECDDGDSDEHDGCPSDCGAPRACGGVAAVVMCRVGEFCEFPRGTCGPQGPVAGGSGVCVEIPEVCICPRVVDPVCGCDGVTHSNDCQRRCAGTSIAHPGACECGRRTCGLGEACCNPVLGICAAPGGICALGGGATRD